MLPREDDGPLQRESIMAWQDWTSDVAAALAGMAALLAALYVIGMLMMGVQITMCDDQCQADRLSAEGRAP